ncbi:MAG: sulfite exporter TauE/SafE family protein [Halioglobus sp.]
MQIELWQALTLTGVGVLAGFLNVMAGGGSLITLPVMIFMGLPGPVANGTNRIAILAQNLSAIAAFFRRGFAEFRLSISLAACAIPGAIVGSMLGVNLEGESFNRLLALVMIAVMLIMHFDRNRGPGDPNSEPTRQQLVRGHLLMVAVGFWGGFIQVGVGFIIMPVLNRVMGLDLVRTNMHKVFIIAVYTAVALAVFASQVELLWVFGAALALGNAIGGYLGAHFAVSKGERLIKLILNLVLIVFIAKLLFFP